MTSLAGLMWLPAPSIELWFIGVFTAGQSLLLATAAALVAGCGLWLRRAEVRGGLALGGLGAAVAVSAVVPAVLAWGVARDADVDIAWGDYFDGTVFSAPGEPATSVTFAVVDGRELHADPPPPARERHSGRSASRAVAATT